MILMDTSQVVFALVFICAGLLVGAAFFVIGYVSSRKATEDVLNERGFVGRISIRRKS